MLVQRGNDIIGKLRKCGAKIDHSIGVWRRDRRWSNGLVDHGGYAAVHEDVVRCVPV